MTARRAAALLAIALAAALGPPAASAHGPTDIYGDPPRGDVAALKRLFLAHHRHGYVIEGYHESLLHHDWEAVYYLHVVAGVNVGSGFVPYRWSPAGIRPMRPTGPVTRNLAPSEYLYVAVLSGSGKYEQATITDPDQPEAETTSHAEFHLTMSGRFGSAGGRGSEPLELTAGEEQPEPAGPAMVLGGTGTFSETNAADPSEDLACTLTVTKGQLQPDLTPLWHGASTLILDLDLGAPEAVSPNPECGGLPSDPTSSEPTIDVSVTIRNPPLGSPFTAPVVLHHTLDSGTVEHQELSLEGSLALVLVGVKPPTSN